jgi:acyl-CoA synthetase (NDP forming)
MERAFLDYSRLFSPRGIAIVGASPDSTRVGGQPIKALKEFGFRGGIYPVNPKYPEVQGLRCYRNLTEVPQPCDVALVAVSSTHVPQAIIDCGNADIRFAVVLSAGFKEIGREGEQIQAKLEEAIRVSGVRVIGPNCQGFMNLKEGVYCGFGAPFQYRHPNFGKIAMVTQSGGFGYAVMGLAEASGLGFNYVISTGNEADVSTLELLNYLLEQSDVEIVATYMEGVSDGRKLIALGRQALQLGKPIVVWKVGNSNLGRQAAASHTANLTASYELYKTAFRQGGFIEVRDVDDLVDVANAFLGKRLPEGDGVAVISISGGAGVLLADRCEELGLKLPSLSQETLVKLRNILPGFSSTLNPIDVTAQVFNDPAIFCQVVEQVACDAAIHQIIVVTASIQGSMAENIARELVKISQRIAKPILVCSSATPERAVEALRILREYKIPCYPTPMRAATAASALQQFSYRVRMQKRQINGTRTVPKISLTLPKGEKTLGDHRSKMILSEYGIPVVKEVLLDPRYIDELKEAPLPFPLVAKLESPDLPHKTEVGAVRVGIRDLEELKMAVRQMQHTVFQYRPDARIDGVLLQELVSGTEVIAGAIDDPFFGPTVLFGLGGVFSEILRDVTYQFAPFNTDTAKEMIKEVKGFRILLGYRGQHEADLEALAEALSRLSHLIADHSTEISEIDINPLFVRPKGGGVVAADALVVLKQ